MQIPEAVGGFKPDLPLMNCTILGDLLPLKSLHFLDYKIRVITKSISQVVLTTTTMHRGDVHCRVEYRDSR